MKRNLNEMREATLVNWEEHVSVRSNGFSKESEAGMFLNIPQQESK